MPTYVYKAVTDKGLIVRNKVESPSRQGLVKMLKNNNLLPISIEQINYRSAKSPKRQKRMLLT